MCYDSNVIYMEDIERFSINRSLDQRFDFPYKEYYCAILHSLIISGKKLAAMHQVNLSLGNDRTSNIHVTSRV